MRTAAPIIKDKTRLKIKGAITLNIGNFITITYNNDDKYMKGKKIGLKGRCRIKNKREKIYLAHIAVYY